MVLDDVVEYEETPGPEGKPPIRKEVNKLESILLNGANVCMLVPGGAAAR